MVVKQKFHLYWQFRFGPKPQNGLSSREVKDRRNNDVLRVWYHAEAWLELIRLVAHDRW